MLKINIYNKYDFGFNISSLSKKVINELLHLEKVNKDILLNILIVGSKKIKTINKNERGIDKVTDVLSFPNIPFKQSADFSTIILNKKIYSSVYDYENKCFYFGDIVICYDKVISQSKKYGHSVKREYAFLLTHSMLHLLGYDHMKCKDEKIMFDKQDIVLNKLKILR